MINVSINTGSVRAGGGRGIQNFLDLEYALQSFPQEIAQANEIAVKQTIDDVKENIRQRSPEISKYISVESKKYGELGFQLRIGESIGSNSGSGSHGRSSSWAVNIFLRSEMGKVGRVKFILKRRKNRPYKISHTSGSFYEGQMFSGPANIPQIGPFYFSAKSGIRSESLNKYAYERMSNNLNRRYAMVLRSIARQRSF